MFGRIGQVLADCVNVDDTIIPGQYIAIIDTNMVPSNATVSSFSIQGIAQQLTGDATGLREGAGPTAELGYVYTEALAGFSFTVPNNKEGDAVVLQIAASPYVLAVEPDRTIEAVSHRKRRHKKKKKKVPVVSPGEVPAPQQALFSGQTLPPGIARVGAANLGTTPIKVQLPSSVAVAVLDTGIDLSHPDLDVIAGRNCIAPNSLITDVVGHGTHVAGTIGALNNNIGVVGVAPGTKIVAVKVLDDSGGGSWSSVICGLDWVRANAESFNIKVVNLSLGGGDSGGDGGCTDQCQCNSALHTAVCQVSMLTGVTVVAAAGNSNQDFRAFVPATYPSVLTVTAIGDSDGRPGGKGAALSCWKSIKDDRPASFSNYATTAEDRAHTIAAPGVCIRSTYKNRSYATLSGTSMACPHVAGMVALCYGVRTSTGVLDGPCAGMSPSQIIQYMIQEAKALGSINGFSGDPNSPKTASTNKYYGYAATCNLK